MRRKYGTIFIAVVLLLTFQILILDESSAQQNGGSYGPAPKLSQFHRIGTSIRANSIRQEAEEPQVTSPQYPFNPNSYSYGPAEYYDPYRPVAGDPSVYDFNSGPPYNDQSLANSYYDDPTSYTNTGCNDPGTLGPNANPIYFDPEASTDPSYGSSGYTESDDSENADDSQSGGGVMSAMRDMLSGMDMNSATGLLGAIGNMMASQGSIANSANPLQAVSTAGTVANAAGTLASAASTGAPAASTFSAEGIDADIPTSPSNSAAFGTDSLSNLNSTLDVETPKNSQNPNYVDNVWAASDEISHTDPTPQNPNTLWDVEGQSLKPVGLDSRTRNKLDVIVNNPHSITPRNPDKVASLWDAVNYFNSQSENSGKSNPMLIFTPVDLDRMESQKDDYEPVLTDEEIAKLYNSLGKKKIKSVLLLTDSNVDTPYELFDEINPPVLEETGGTEHIINKLGDQYHFIPLSDESAKKLIPLISLPLNLETTSKDEVSNLFKSQIMDNYEDVLKQIEDYYGIVLKEQESTSKTTPDIGVNSTAGENVYTSARVRKDNEDFMKEMDKFYEFIPAGMDLSQKQSTEIAPHSKLKEQSLMDIDSSRVSNNSLVSEKYDGNMPVQSDLKSTKLSGGLVNREVMPIFLLTDDAENILKKLNHSQPFKRESDDLIETLSEFYKFEPVGVGSPGHSGFDEMMFLPENKKSNENNFDTFGKHNQDIINSLSKYYEYIPSGRNYLSDQEPSNKNNTERVKKHNNDIIKSISNFYDLIPLKELADETAPGENIYSSGQETSNKNNSGIVEKHNNDTESINDFYEYIPSKKMADVKAPGTKIYSSDQEISNNNGRVKKHNNDIIEPMSNFYELIPLKELLADQAAPETNIYSYDQEISNKNDSERVRKDNNDMIRSMSNFYDSLPTGIDSFKRPSPAIHPQSIINDDQSAIGFSNGNDIIEAHDVNGIMDSIRNNEISTSTPRIYRMIPKIRTFTRSGIEVKNNYFLEDLRSKLGSEFNIDDKLLVINNGIGNGKEYFLAKERTKSSGEKLSRENGGFLPKTSESSQKPCQTSHIICEQKPSKYIFRFTCYDPESYHNHTGNQSLILHFDCLNKISPIITNILKNVDNHHSASSGCSTNNICENKSHPDSSSGESYTKDWKSSPDVIDNSKYNNNHNPVYSIDANVSPVPINPGNRGGSSIDYHDFKSSTENSYTELSVPEETSFKNCEVYQSEKYAKSNSDTSDVYDSTKIESYSQPANRLSSQSSQPLNYPDKTPSYAAVQNMESKLNFNDVKTLSASQQDFKQEKYQSEPDTASKLTNSDSYDSSNDSIVLSVDSIPYSGSHENLGISSRPFIPDKGSSSCNSQLETQPPFYQNTQQSSPDTTLDNGFRNSVYDSPQEPMMEKGRNSIMTISKSDKQKYADKLKNSVLEQGGRIENSTCVIDNHISEAIETLLNNSLQPCSKVEEILPCHPSTGSINSNKPSAPIIKPLCPVNINGAVNLDDSTIPVQQCLEIPKCHLEECVSTKHTQKILKHQDSTKLVHGFECKKTIQSNVCGDNIGPCNLRSDCKISLPSSCKECETLANFLDKISQTLDKNINSCKEKENK